MLRHRLPHHAPEEGTTWEAEDNDCLQASFTGGNSSSRRWMYLSGALLVALLWQSLQQSSSSVFVEKSSSTSTSECMVSFGPYRGHEYTTKEGGTVGKPTCLVESKWMKVQQHKVVAPATSTVIDDWLWIDYHDRVNVLVEDETSSDGDRRFLVFQQTKYALEGRTSLAIIGGIIEPGEEPKVAAQREVGEEMGGLHCQDFHFLGRYRTDVNRGIGWVNSFLASRCSRSQNRRFLPGASKATADEEVGAADTERQDLMSITLSELRESSRRGAFLEVQWSNTVALALQHPKLNGTSL